MNQSDTIGQTARKLNLVSCHACGRLSELEQTHCSRCMAPLHQRKINSIQRAWALTITAAFLYIPAMIYPVTTVYALGEAESSTLMGSVMHFLESGAWPISLVIFIASVVVPLLKIIGLSYLLLSIRFAPKAHRLPRTRLYRVVELIGRWSMIDVFVVAILVALVQVGIFINIIPGIGIMAFTGVVVITMLAAMSFDPRLIWDDNLSTNER